MCVCVCVCVLWISAAYYETKPFRHCHTVLPTTQLPQVSSRSKKKFNVENERSWLTGLSDKPRCINYTADKCKQWHAMLQVRSTFRDFKTLMMHRTSHTEQSSTEHHISEHRSETRKPTIILIMWWKFVSERWSSTSGAAAKSWRLQTYTVDPEVTKYNYKAYTHVRGSVRK